MYEGGYQDAAALAARRLRLPAHALRLLRATRCALLGVRQGSGVHKRGGLVKGGLAIYAFPLCNCNALGIRLRF